MKICNITLETKKKFDFKWHGGNAQTAGARMIMRHYTRNGGGTLMSRPFSSKMLMKARLCLSPTS